MFINSDVIGSNEITSCSLATEQKFFDNLMLHDYIVIKTSRNVLSHLKTSTLFSEDGQ